MMSNSITPPDTVPIREAQKFDLNALEQYLKANMPHFSAPLKVRQFEGGQSNPTFVVESGNQRFVLRKKPPGDLLASAHQVEREYRIMQALKETSVPVPQMHLLCEDTSIIGTSFYIMDYVEGRIFRDPKLPGLSSQDRSLIFDSLCQTAASLHSLDWRQLGLTDFGKQQSYLARQVSRWTKAYEATKSVSIPAMESLKDWLTERIPASDAEGAEITIAHGDLRLENMIYHPTEPKVLAVLDWELSTLGHPLGDLAYACIPYHLPSNIDGLPGLKGIDVNTMGIPTEVEFVAQYARLTKRDTISDYNFFVVFSLFRLASIAQGVQHRAMQGIASSEKAEKVGRLAKLFADTGLELATRV